MLEILYQLSSIFILIIALSLDAFVASIAYGTNEIKIPIASASIISVICSAVLAAALSIGSVMDQFIPESLTRVICFLSLLLLGIIKLLDYTIKAYINKHNEINKNISFSFSRLHFILNIYGNPIAADQDESRILSKSEAVFLALAMSLDGLIAGVGAAFLKINILLTVLLSFAVGMAAIIGGCYFGNKIAVKTKIDLSWLSGLLFIVLAIVKMT